jgi:hypothetical protein
MKTKEEGIDPGDIFTSEQSYTHLPTRRRYRAHSQTRAEAEYR